MRQLIGQYVFTLISLIAAAITIYQFKTTQYNAAPDDLRIAVLFIGGLASFFLGESLYYRIRWGRESRYARVLDNINRAFTTVHYLDMVNESAENIMLAMVDFCTQCSFAFSFITGSKCYVTIKIIESMEKDDRKDFAAVTLFRDGEASVKRIKEDGKVTHWLTQNTTYSEIMKYYNEPTKRFFLNNHLPFYDYYQNTSSQLYGNPKTLEIRYLGSFVRNLTWKLPYKSTLVVPICPMNTIERKEIIGFLCVDSRDRGVFKRRFDLDLCVGIADGIALKIKQLQDNQKRFGKRG